MAQVDEAKFSCQGCGKTYKWKPEFAGRKVKCKCGYVMTAPAAPPAPPAAEDEPDLDALYDLAADGKAAAATAPPMMRCPSCQSEMEVGSTECPTCGFNMKKGKPAKKQQPVASGGAVIPGKPAAAAKTSAGGGGGASGLAAYSAFGAPKRGLQQEASRPDDKVLDLYVPLAVLIAGLIMHVIQTNKFDKIIYPLGQAIQIVGVEFIVSMVLLAIGCLFVMRVAEVAFGSPGPAALKIAAIAIAPAALAKMVDYLLNDPFGIVGFFLAFGMFFALFNYLFDMDQGEIWILAGLTLVIQMWATNTLTIFLLGAMGMPGMQQIAHGGKSNDDRMVANFIEIGRLKEGKEWVEDNAGRCFADLTHEQSLEIVNGFLDAGAKSLKVIAPAGSVGSGLFVELPSSAKKRQACFDFWKTESAKVKKGGGADEGQKWLVIRFEFFTEPEL